MQMLEPDFWQGKGRYSKQALSRKVKDEAPFVPPENVSEDGEKK